MSIRVIYVSLLLILTVLSSCDDQLKHNDYRIGVSQCSGGSWRDKQNNEMLRELLLHDDATMELLCAVDHGKKQIEDIQYFIDNTINHPFFLFSYISICRCANIYIFFITTKK